MFKQSNFSKTDYALWWVIDRSWWAFDITFNKKVSQVSAEHKNNVKPKPRGFIYSLETWHNF